MSFNRYKILKMMQEANISGVSIATRNKDGKISFITLGTSGCGLFNMDKIPSAAVQSEFDSSRYILSEAGFFYYNQTNKEFLEITDDKTELNELKEYFSEGKEIFVLSDEQLHQIKNITGDEHLSTAIKADTVFAAASLNKPLFAYLVLKLIEENKSNPGEVGLGKFNLPKGLTKFNLDTPLYKILPGLSEGGEKAEKLTTRMVLAHTTGIPMSTDDKSPEFLFEPGTEYGYNGVPYFYLQMAIEKLTGTPLQELNPGKIL